MYRLFVALTIALAIEHSTVTSYQWITLKPDDPIPEQAVILDAEATTYVGRARHYNLALPAEVHNTTYARISSCSKIFKKQQFEVLVATEHCEWKEFKSLDDVPENVVRGGTAANGEPIFIGKIQAKDSYMYIVRFLLTTKQVIKFPNTEGIVLWLICDTTNSWVDSSSANIPNKSVSGGISEDGNTIYVARLLNGCDVISGQVIPELGIATALDQGITIKASYCQVLVGDDAEYEWVSAKDGDIPDYAVVAGKQEDGELMYVVRMNQTLGYILHGDALANKLRYKILVKKHD